MYLDIIIQSNINTLKQLETDDMNKAIQVLRENQHFNKWFIEATAEAIEKASEKARAEERKKFNEELIKMQAELIKKQSEEHVKLIEAARKLKQLGLNNESIVETTGLHLNEVECLK
jgi:predicted transposase YdaD